MEHVIIYLTGDQCTSTQELELNIAYGLITKIPNDLRKKWTNKDFPNATMVFFPHGIDLFGIEGGHALWDLVEGNTYYFPKNSDKFLDEIVQKWKKKKPYLVKDEEILDAWNMLSTQEKLEAYTNVDRYFSSKANKYIHNLHKWLKGKYFKTDKIMKDEIIFGYDPK